MNTISHYRNVRQLNTMIDSYEKKLDEKINEMFHYVENQQQTQIINSSPNTNDIVLPRINHKKKQKEGKNVHESRRKGKPKSIYNKSFAINHEMSISQDYIDANNLINVYKSMNQRQANQRNTENSLIMPPEGRSMGGRIFVKPKLVRKKPQILNKQMRLDPFLQKNVIKAQQLNQGLLNLIQRGKVAKNIDIITAFEKGRPIFEAHQAVVHHMEEKFTSSFLNQCLPNKNQVDHKKENQIDKNPQNNNNYNGNNNVVRKFSVNSDQVMHFVGEQNNDWAITAPEDSQRKGVKEKNKINNIIDDCLQLNYIRFLHYKLVKDESYQEMKKLPQFQKKWGQISEIINQIEKLLKKYNVETIYCNANKILQLANKRQSLKKIKISDVEECLVSIIGSKGKNIKIFSIKSMTNHQSKTQQAISLISSALDYKKTRGKYLEILKHKKFQNKIQQWVLNSQLIRNYKKKLIQHKKDVLKTFQCQQSKFRTNLQSIQSSKHFEIHVANRQYMRGFKHFQQYCNTEITRIFNLGSINTNIIYVSPFQLSVDTINYYFKIMELEEIDNYNERVTFLQLQEKIKLPATLNTSKKLYYNSKALKKLKKKIQGTPAYFVINYPSEVDIFLSVFLEIPIYSGDFSKINPVRSLLSSEKFLCQTLQPTNSFVVQPKQYTQFEIFNALLRYFEANRKSKKHIVKINNFNSSIGLALLSYPFNSLPDMYSNTVLIHNYYFTSVQDFYSQLAKKGGVIQRYEQGLKSMTICAKIFHDFKHIILGTFQKISSGFINVAYIFPQKIVPHNLLVQKSKEILDKLATEGHVGFVQLTVTVNLNDEMFLEEVQLYSTKITNSLLYYQFLAGGSFNEVGEFVTKITPQMGQNEAQQSILQPRSYCYIPFILHFGLSDQQASTFFQLCRIGGVSFDLQNKLGITFIVLGSVKDTVGILTTAKDRKKIINYVSKTTEFLIKQNAHNISVDMLRQKEIRMKQRVNVTSIKQRMEEII